jgi:predicted transcriptional regulator
MRKETQLLNDMLSSSVKGELLMLFHKNPGTIDTAEEIARRIGRTGPDIESDLASLVRLGVLKERMVGRLQAFQLDRSKDRALQESFTEYFRSLDRRTG